MERYDGKTKKDDYKKYALIAAGIILVIVLYKVITSVTYALSHPTPDITVVVGCEAVIDFQMEDEMELYLKEFATDLDGNGKVVVDLVPYDIRRNEAVDASGVLEVGGWERFGASIENGDGALYLMTRGTFSAKRSYANGDNCAALPEDLAPAEEPWCVEITGCELLQEQGFGQAQFYGAISKYATDQEYELAVEILRQLKTK